MRADRRGVSFSRDPSPEPLWVAKTSSDSDERPIKGDVKRHFSLYANSMPKTTRSEAKSRRTQAGPKNRALIPHEFW
jgi:hypothetical protein